MIVSGKKKKKRGRGGTLFYNLLQSQSWWVAQNVFCIKSFAENVVGTCTNGRIRTQNLTFYVNIKKKKKDLRAPFPFAVWPSCMRQTPRAALIKRANTSCAVLQFWQGSEVLSPGPNRGDANPCMTYTLDFHNSYESYRYAVRQNIEQRYSSERRLNTQ